MIFHRRLTNRMEPGNSFLKPQANCRALMDGSEKCLKTSSCRALNALKGKDSEKMAVLGLMDGLCAFLPAGKGVELAVNIN
jgi:hypothetical protein